MSEPTTCPTCRGSGQVMRHYCKGEVCDCDGSVASPAAEPLAEPSEDIAFLAARVRELAAATRELEAERDRALEALVAVRRDARALAVVSAYESGARDGIAQAVDRLDLLDMSIIANAAELWSQHYDSPAFRAALLRALAGETP